MKLNYFNIFHQIFYKLILIKQKMDSNMNIICLKECYIVGVIKKDKSLYYLCYNIYVFKKVSIIPYNTNVQNINPILLIKIKIS